MKKFKIIKFIVLMLFLSISIEILIAQNTSNNITFILNRYETGKIFKTLPNGEKYLEFEISKFENQFQLDSLKKHIAGYRGVISFLISKDDINKKNTGKLTCYKYADNLLYYRHLFFVNNVNHLIVDGKEILTDSLLDIEK